MIRTAFLILWIVPVLVLSGYGRYIFVRDQNRQPVPDATLFMTSDRIVGEHEFQKTNECGEGHLSIQVPGVKSVGARKPGYRDAISLRVNDETVIQVLIPQ